MAPRRAGMSSEGLGDASAPITMSRSAPTYMFWVSAVTASAPAAASPAAGVRRVCGRTDAGLSVQPQAAAARVRQSRRIFIGPPRDGGGRRITPRRSRDKVKRRPSVALDCRLTTGHETPADPLERDPHPPLDMGTPVVDGRERTSGAGIPWTGNGGNDYGAISSVYSGSTFSKNTPCS